MKTSEWTAALRSGQYTQGRSYLCDGTNYCCLGVLAEEAGVEKLQSDDGIRAPIYRFTDPEDDALHYRSRTSIPQAVARTILEDQDLEHRLTDEPTMTSSEGLSFTYGESSLMGRLMSMNDDGFTFQEIADYIDQVRKSQ